MLVCIYTHLFQKEISCSSLVITCVIGRNSPLTLVCVGTLSVTIKHEKYHIDNITKKIPHEYFVNSESTSQLIRVVSFDAYVKRMERRNLSDWYAERDFTFFKFS